VSEQTWEALTEVDGELNAEIMRGLLEAQGIPVNLSQEGAGKVYGLTVGEFGKVEILVPSNYLAQARQVLTDLDKGVFDSPVEGDETDFGENLPDIE
jgi:hypothetical protein